MKSRLRIILLALSLLTSMGVVFSQPLTVSGTNPACLTGAGDSFYSVSGSGGLPVDWGVVGGTVMSGHGTPSISVRWDRRTASGQTSVSASTSQWVEVWVYPPPYQEYVCQYLPVNYCDGFPIPISNSIDEAIMLRPIDCFEGWEYVCWWQWVYPEPYLDYQQIFNSSNIFYVTVNAVPSPVSFNYITNPACVGSSGNGYYVSATPYTYLWSVSPGDEVAGNGNAALVTWNTAGTRSVSVSVVDGGCQSSVTTANVNVITPPVATFTSQGAGNVCVGSAGNTFTTQSGMYPYEWSIPAGALVTSGGGETQDYVTITWQTSGSKTVSVWYKNGGCQSSVASATVNVNSPPATAVLSGGGTVCQGQSANLVVTITGGNSPYNFTINGYGAVSNYISGTPIGVSPSTTTGYSLGSVAGSGGCSVAGSGGATVTVNPLPTSAVLSGGGTVCQGQSANLVVTISGGSSPYNFTINGYGAVSNYVSGTAISVSPSTTTSYSLGTVSGSNGCSVGGSGGATITVNPLPTSAVLSGGGTVCRGQSANLIVTISGGSSPYNFTINGYGAVSNYISGTAISVSPSTTTSYSLGTVIGSNGCSVGGSGGATVTVNQLPVPTFITAPDPVCGASAGNVYSTQSGMTSYVWAVSPGGTITAGGNSTSNNATVTWNTIGVQTVSVRYTDGNGCVALAPTTKNVTVKPLPTAITSVAGLKVSFANERFRLQVQGSAEANSFNWVPQTGLTVTNTTGTGVAGREVIVNVSAAGARTLQVKAVRDGCEGPAFNVPVNILSSAQQNQLITLTKPELTALSEGYLYLNKHSSNYVGCIGEFGPVTIEAKLDLGNTYNLGERVFGFTIGVTVTAYYDLPGVEQSWTIPYVINANNPEQLFRKELPVNPFLLKFIKIKVNSYSATDAVAENFVRLVASYDEKDKVNVSAATVSLTAPVIDNTKWEQNFAWTSSCIDVTQYEYQLLRVYGSETIDWQKSLKLYVEKSTNQMISMAEGSGNYRWRVRAIGTLDGGVTNTANYGQWSTEGTFSYTHPEENQNWIYSRTFTEGNRVSEQLTYANGLQQVAQQQTRIQGDNQIVATQTMQDFTGRNALSSLPIPVTGTSQNRLGYVSGLLKNGVNPLKAVDFDTDPYTTPLVSDQSSYYGGTDNGINAGVASAEGYPYTRTLFLEDGTGRVKEQGGVGATHAVKTGGKTVKTFYSNPNEAELVMLFGREAPEARSVQKITTLDANGTGSVTYKTKDGKVVATALTVNTSTGPLTALPSRATASRALFEEIKGNNKINESTVVSRKPLLFPINTDIIVDYQITPAQLKELCGGGQDESLVGYYPMEGTGSDQSGSGNDGVVNGGPATMIDNFNGLAYNFDGTDDFIQVSDAPELDFGAGDFTVSMWVRKAANTVNWDNSIGVNKWNNGGVLGSNEWSLSLSSTASNNLPSFWIESGTAQYNVVGTTSLALNTWFHVVGERIGNQLKIYVNGALQGTTNIPAGVVVNDRGLPLLIGKIPSGYNTAAAYDEVQIYRRGLSLDEVKVLYQRGGSLCKTCDYTIEFKLYKQDDPNYVHPGLPAPYLIRAGECSEQATLAWDPAAFTLTGLQGGVNYVLEKSLRTRNKNTVTQQLYIDEQAAQIRSFYQSQFNTQLATINGFVSTQNLAGLYSYLDGLVTGGTASYDAVANQYMVLLGTGTTGCPDYVFVPKLELCPDETISADCSTMGGQTFEAYAEAQLAMQDPAFTRLNGNSQLSYLFFKNGYTKTKQYFLPTQLNTMMANLLADNSGSNGLVTCALLWDVWKEEVRGFTARGKIDLTGADLTDYSSAVVAGENDLLGSFFNSLEGKLQAMMTTQDICTTAAGGKNYFVKKTVLYGFIGGAVTTAGADSDNASAVDVTRVYRLVYIDDRVADMANGLRYYAEAPLPTTPTTLAMFTGASMTLCDKYQLNQLTRFGDFTVVDKEAKKQAILSKLRSTCGTACEARGEEFRQAIIDNIISTTPTAKIQYYAISTGFNGKNIGVYDITVNPTVFDYSQCELDKMVDALIQNCIDNYCNTTLTQNANGTLGTTAEWNKIEKALTYEFEVQVKQSGQTCSAGYDYMDAVKVNTGRTPPIPDILQGWQYGAVSSPNPSFNNVFVVTSTADNNNPGTLRWAINQANAVTGGNPILISFNIIGQGKQTIDLLSPLPYITVSNLTIDGSTQPGFTGASGPMIVVKAVYAINVCLLGVLNGNSTIKYLELIYENGLVVSLGYANNKVISNKITGAAGIFANLSNNLIVQGNIITITKPDQTGIWIVQSVNGLIGGSSVNEGNIIENAVFPIHFGISNSNCLVKNNRIVNSQGWLGVLLGTNISGPSQSSNGIRASQNLTTKNPFSTNTISFKPVAYYSGNNSNKPPAIITGISVQVGGVHKIDGTAQAGDLIELFMGRPNSTGANAEIYIGSTVAATNGTWTFTAPLLPTYKVTAVATDVVNSSYSYTHPIAIPPLFSCTTRSLCFRFTTPVTTAGNLVVVPPGLSDVVFQPTEEKCKDASAAIVKASLGQQVEQLINGRIKNFTDLYASKCTDPALINDKLTLSYSTGLHHFTLYYYDRAGNLMKTVPPRGVALLAVNTPAAVATAKATFPAHTLITEYQYNSLGQLIRERTPDANADPTLSAADQTTFYARPVSTSTETQFNTSRYYATYLYNDKGQLRFSRNAKQKQATDGSYSYTKYDNLGRVMEVGEATGYVESDAQLNRNNNGTYPATNLRQLTRTFYTQPFEVAQLPAGYAQRHLRNRVSYAYLDEDGLDATTNDRTHTAYSYDPHGNVEWLVQLIPGLPATGIKYQYDLISGKILQVDYNPGKADQFSHKYDYDANNRITKVYTSKDGQLWEQEANYDYYKHGPLKRTVIGEDQVQGMDYTYTIHGWLKALNHPLLDKTNDPNRDGDTGSAVGRDAFGMALTYFSGDYKRTGSTLETTHASTLLPAATRDLYNGNIAAWTGNMFYTGSLNTTFANASLNYKQLTGYQYQYDELNRLLNASQQNFSGTAWAVAPTSNFTNQFTYDATGNIATQITYGGTTTPYIDNATYNYYANTNRLRHITDSWGDDIENQATDNYQYDPIGNITRDVQQQTRITWTPYGKVKRVDKTNAGGTPTGAYTEFTYDAQGNRVAKKQVNTAGLAKTNYYVRDASGNTLAVYEKIEQAGTTPETNLIEMYLYGSDRLGVYRKAVRIDAATTAPVLQPGELRIATNTTKSLYEGANYLTSTGVTLTLGAGFSYSSSAATGQTFSVRVSESGGAMAPADGVYTRMLNTRQYELKDHLGNVRTVVTDQKLSLVTAGIPGAYEGKVVSASNYYPFGMDQPGRTWSAEGKYRFGYNTQEKVDEISGSGNHYTAQFWEYDPRIVRRWNRDPVTYPWQSPYAINNNNPIIFSDPLGLFGSRKEAREYRKEHNLKGRIRIDNEGYYSIDDKKAGTSIFKDAESGKIWTAALITAERSDHKNTTPFQLGVEWLTGKGPKSRDFTSGDQTVELYKQHDHYKNALSDVTGKLQSLSPNSPLPDYGYPYQLKGIEGVGKYVQDYSTLATGGQTGNLMFTYLGSHSLWIEVTANDVEKRIATVVFTVHNTSTLESGTRPPVIGYQEWYGNTIGNFLNTKVAGRTGATSETEQVFQWTQTIKY